MQLECRTGKKNKKFSDVNLLDFTEKLEAILERVKELKCLCHLIEPIETALAKLRELNERIDQYSCNQYGDFACPEECRQIPELTCARAPPAERRSNQESPSSDGSCGCRNSRGERSCHCGSSRDSVEPNLHKTETYCIKETPRCSPCRCTVDANGKSVKSRDCKQAARARREMREARASEARPRTADAKLTSQADPEIVLLGATVSQTMIKVEASWPEKTFKFTKEDTLMEPATERAILCNMSSDSSSEDSSCSNNACQLLDYKQREEAPCLAKLNNRNSYKNSNIYHSDSYLDACGCDRTAADNACPCGCGDLMELPEKTREPRGENRSHCRCENCGKEITEGDQDGAACTLSNRDRRGPGQKSLGSSRCGKEASRTVDIQKYIEELEEQCRKKDNIITQLQDQLINLNDGCC